MGFLAWLFGYEGPALVEFGTTQDLLLADPEYALSLEVPNYSRRFESWDQAMAFAKEMARNLGRDVTIISLKRFKAYRVTSSGMIRPDFERTRLMSR